MSIVYVVECIAIKVEGWFMDVVGYIDGCKDPSARDGIHGCFNVGWLSYDSLALSYF